jgi:hypothetical protein
LVDISKLSDKRKSFLHLMFTTAIEGGISYWAGCREYHWMKPEFAGQSGYPAHCEDIDGFYATIVSPAGEWGVFDEDDDRELRIDLGVMAAGVELFWKYCMGLIDSRGKSVPMEARTWIAEDHYWRQWMVQNLTNGEEGDSDSIVASEIVQWGLFGASVYG